MPSVLDINAANGRLSNAGPAPTITVLSNAGTGATGSVSGGNISGTISITAGLIPISGGIAKFTHAVPLSNPPSAVHITPCNALSINLVFVTWDALSFTISGLVISGSTYAFCYTIII